MFAHPLAILERRGAVRWHSARRLVRAIDGPRVRPAARGEGRVRARRAFAVALLAVRVTAPVVTRRDHRVAVGIGEHEDVRQVVELAVAVIDDARAARAVTTLVVVIVSEDDCEPARQHVVIFRDVL